jgi:hypothetical protein
MLIVEMALQDGKILYIRVISNSLRNINNPNTLFYERMVIMLYIMILIILVGNIQINLDNKDWR